MSKTRKGGNAIKDILEGWRQPEHLITSSSFTVSLIKSECPGSHKNNLLRLIAAAFAVPNSHILIDSATPV